MAGVIFIGGHGTALGYAEEERTKKQILPTTQSLILIFPAGPIATRAPIPAVAMREWMNATVERIAALGG